MTALLPELRGYALALVRNWPEAEDVSQQAALQAWRARDTFAEGTNFKAWMFKITRNVIYTRHQTKYRYMPFDAEAFDMLIHNEAEAPHRIALRELLAWMHDPVNMSSACAEAILLMVYHGCTYEDVAHIQNIPIGTAKSRIHRARQCIKAKFDHM